MSQEPDFLLPAPVRIELPPAKPGVEPISLSVQMAGEGPPVVLCHGFPELSISWARQIAALAEAGYRVIAPDQRGVGGSDRPEAVDAYGLGELTGDLVGLLDALEIDRAFFAGHDFGGITTWALGVLHPERVSGLIGVNTPYMARGKEPMLKQLRRLVFGHDRFIYLLWVQKPGVADPVFDRDARLVYEKLVRGGVPVWQAFARAMLAGNFNLNPFAHLKQLPRIGRTLLSPEEVDHYTETFQRTGFTGALNGYRNFDRNWSEFPEVGTAKIELPSLMITAEWDPALRPSMAKAMKPLVPGLEIHAIERCGHWTQYDRPDELSRALIEWLDRMTQR